jgi:ADP-ribosyl-[dinitrogen reductase] hydrolase
MTHGPRHEEVPPPLASAYWLLPGRLLAGEYPGMPQEEGTRDRIQALLAAGVDCFVNLTAPDELPSYEELLPAHVSHHRRPIRDHGLPELPEYMVDILELIEGSLRAGHRLYVHCRAGIGRTNTVLGCLLVEQGMSGDAALEELNRCFLASARAVLWPMGVPETPEQIDYVRHWRPALAVHGATVAQSASVFASALHRVEEPLGLRSSAALRARFRGALIGLAIGDALAGTTQTLSPGSFPRVGDFGSGGPLNLPRGAWTDDTAMALCLAESLVSCHGFDPRDQLERYTLWQQAGHLSATGECVGITSATQRALASAHWRRQVFSGSHDPKQLDPEPLARVAPAVLYGFGSFAESIRLAGEAARSTCQAPLVVEACRVFAAMLHAALSGRDKPEVLAASAQPEEGRTLRPRLRALLRGRFLRQSAAHIRAGPTIIEALEAALWAFHHGADFREGALLAANLGGCSDVVAAAYGQLAGAYYTLNGIPAEWRAALLRIDLLETLADQLLAEACTPPPS